MSSYRANDGRVVDTDERCRFFTRVDRILRRSLGVSETAPTDTTVKPAPPVDPELPLEDAVDGADEDVVVDGNPHIQTPEHVQDQGYWEVEEIDEEGNPVQKVTPSHDEL